MGEIRKDNLHESLIEELNELANIDLSGKQDKTDESLLTESKDVIGAINELFQSANNGKELIANAIGEPVSSEDTFQAMSNDINSLLSQFKTNMMNSGVTVNSSDKFKQLIDKIKGLTEGEGNKGLIFESNTVSTASATDTINCVIDTGATVSNIKYLPLSFNFEPTIILAVLTTSLSSVEIAMYGTTYPNILVEKIVSKGLSTLYSIKKTDVITTDNKTFKFPVISTGTFTYYAIGVGEEDTTLRDSLANILQEEGVSVTEEDDMVSLITKVDQEFDRKNANSAKLDIIFASELPTTVKEGQVVIISNTEGNVYINKTDPGNLINGDVFIEVNHLESVVDIPIQTEGLDVGIPVYRANQFNDGVGSQVMCYVGKNGKWVETVPNDIYLYSPEQGLHPKLGEFVLNSSTVSFGVEYLTFVAKASSGTMTTRTATSKNKIDVTRFTKLEVIAGGNTYGANSGQALKVTIGNKSAFMVDQNGKYTKTVDITDLTGEHNLVLSCNTAYGDYTCLIYSIRLYV
jgi:hypothetical protein